MTRTIEDWVCELIPGIWLAEDKVLMPNEQLMGKCNIWDALIRPKQYLECKVKDLVEQNPAWKDLFEENKGYPKYYMAGLTITIRKEDEDNGDTVG